MIVYQNQIAMGFNGLSFILSATLSLSPSSATALTPSSNLAAFQLSKPSIQKESVQQHSVQIKSTAGFPQEFAQILKLAQIQPVQLNANALAQFMMGLGLVGGAIAIAAGVCRHQQDARWNRIEYLRKTVKEFEQDPNIWRALKILDFEEYRDYEVEINGEKTLFEVNNELLCAALATHDESVLRKREIEILRSKKILEDTDREKIRNYQITMVIRDWFNRMLNGLEHFGYLIDSGMFTANEVRPWMIYWIRLIADRAYKRPGASKFYDQLYSYIHNYGFSGVLSFFEHYGYRLLPTPYKETDFADLNKGLKGFDLRTALSLAKAAYLIYEDKQYVAEISNRWKVDTGENFKYFNQGDRDTQAFMFTTPDFMVVAFRGSQELRDWQTNFQTRLKKVPVRSKMEPLEEDREPPRGQVHRGFQTAWTSIENDVIHQIKEWNQGRSTPLPLFITGHSLGGALATVAAASLIKQGFAVQGLYTFGQPRVGDLIFASEIGSSLQGKVFRFVNNNDIVPHVPPPYLPWNFLRIYRHIGQTIYFDFRGNLVFHPNPIARTIDFMIGLMRDTFEPGFDMINDHRMEFYISNLKKAYEVELEKMKLEKADR